MKISDVLAGKKEQLVKPNLNTNEAELLKQQREQMEQELQASIGVEQDNIPSPEEFEEFQQQFQQQNIPPQPQQRVNIPTPQRQQVQAPPQPQVSNYNVPNPEVDINAPKLYKITVFMDNQQKLPITFEATPNELVIIMKNIDVLIETGKMITIGDFKFPGNKVLYIDMMGR